MEQSFLSILLISILQLAYLVGIFIVVGLLLGVMEKQSNRYLMRTFGYKGVLATAWIGTPIHELGHAIMCLLFRHRIIKIKLLQLNDPNGILGYVEHAYNTKSIYQRVGTFFIGLAPVFSGILALIVSMYFLVPSSYEVFQTYMQTKVEAGAINKETIGAMFLTSFTLLKSLFSFSHFLNPSFWLFLLLAISISSHIALSPADIKESAHGLTMLFGVLVTLNIVSNYVGFNSQEIIMVISRYNTYFLAFSSVAFVFSGLTLLISYMLYQTKRRTG
jgi:hypothetical protein